MRLERIYFGRKENSLKPHNLASLSALRAPQVDIAEVAHAAERRPEVRAPHGHHRPLDVEHHHERETSLLTTYWSAPTLSLRLCVGPASRHGGLNSLFQVALHLPSYATLDIAEVAHAAERRPEVRAWFRGLGLGFRIEGLGFRV